MSENLRCPNAEPVRVDGETVIRRCRGQIVPSQGDSKFICSDEGEEMVFDPEVVESFEASPVWHRTVAVNKMLFLLTPRNPAAYNGSYPWIDIPMGEGSARVDTTTGTWDVHFSRDEHPYETQPTHISTETDDTEAVARKIAEILESHSSAAT